MKSHEKQKMLVLYKQWRQSGKSVKAFCQESMISHSTFHYWIKKFNDEPAVQSSQSPGFLPLVLGGTDVKDSRRALLCIHLASGACIEVYEAIDVEYLKRLCQ
jgi:hypothetical protein